MSIIVLLMVLLCLFPIVNILSESFSENTAVQAGEIWFWPVGFNLKSYAYVLRRAPFWRAMLISFQRVLLGGGMNLAICLLTAYPLSKDRARFKMRTVYVWFIFFTALFSGGLIPSYIIVKQLGLLNSIWALVLPSAVPVFNVLLMINFYRSIPAALEEAALIDGAGQWRILVKIFIPASLPAIATIVIFSMVAHWNSWFDGIIYMNTPTNYPVSSYLRILLFQSNIMQTGPAADSQALKEVSERTLKAAQMFIGILPILLVYPFMQKYFVKGIMLGSVKG